LNRPSATQATALAGILVAAAAVLGSVAGIELSREPHAGIWSNAWLLTSLILTGIAVVVVAAYFVGSMFIREKNKDAPARNHGQDEGKIADPVPDLREEVAGTKTDELKPAFPATHDSTHTETASTDPFASALDPLGLSESVPLSTESTSPQATQPAFVDRWRHTSNGFEAAPLMNMTSLALPGFTSMQGQTAQLRIGVSIACDPSPANASSSMFGAKMLGFLRRDAVAELVKSVTGSGEGLVWTRLAGNGALSLEAVLCPPGQQDNPVASALLQPPVKGVRLFGRNEGTACLWLHIDPQGTGDALRAAGLADWYRRFLLVFGVARAFPEFLSNDLGLKTSDEPATRAGVMIQSAGPLSGLVDSGNLPTLPGGFGSNQFLGYAIADREGLPDNRIVRDLLSQLCDHNLHLTDFEDVLESISAENEAQPKPGTRQQPGVQSTWETRELPVLMAVLKLLDQPGSFEATVRQISEETGIDKADVDRALEALEGEYISKYQRFLTGGDPSTWAVEGITSKARRAVSQWPDE
jgi:hypothetical protein